MATLRDVFAQLNALKPDGIIADYAIGGATAVLFYAEPTRTYDVDVFVLMRPPREGALAEEAVAAARTLDYEGVPVRVIGPEHLAALAFQAGGETMVPPRNSPIADTLADTKSRWHREQARLPIREKFRILLKLQADDLPLIQKRRALRAWEKPWPIQP